MKAILAISAGSLAMLLGGVTQAADIYGSIKDTGPTAEQYAVRTHSGLYIRGDLGLGNGDRTMSRTIDREAGINLDTTGIDPADVQDAQDDLAAAGINSTLNGNALSIPLIGDRLGLSGDDDFSTAVFGVEAMYLMKPAQASVGLSVGLGLTVYGDNETTMSHNGATGTWSEGTLASAVGTATGCAIPLCAGQDSIFAQTGVVSFQRELDIDVPIRFHWFANDRLAFFVGAGPSFARGSFSAVNSSDPGLNDVFGTAFKDESWQIGYVAMAGFDYWATNRLTIGGEVSYKQHDFDASGSNGTTVPLGGPVELYGKVSDRVDVEDDVWTIKGRIGYKLTD